MQVSAVSDHIPCYCCCNETFDMSRINIPKQKGLEVTAVLIKNKNNEALKLPNIVFAVYSSPRSKFKSDLLDFLTVQIAKFIQKLL